ncbi:MAG: hypothetical protein U9R02_00840 [Thermodesulfobacteriota bacterium]|nr:hypothetical protein [Thermodesulfobacteriota bacterium]
MLFKILDYLDIKYSIKPFSGGYKIERIGRNLAMLHGMRMSIVLIVFSFFLLGCNQSSSPVFQEEIRGLKLVQVITGKDALVAINKLHGKKINVARGMIAIYQGKGEKAIVWVSESDCTDDAIQQTESMIERMRASKRSPFSNYEVIELNGVKIYSFQGMGQKHYIFRISKDIYWISANSGTIDELCKSIVG